jgi:hypothetical protein
MPKTRETARRTGTETVEESTTPSPTAVAAEAQRTGVLPLTAGEGLDQVRQHDDEEAYGDGDEHAMDRDSIGELGPGGSMSNPELNGVDEIGRAAGVQEEDSGSLRTSAEILDGRDQRRAQADEPDPNPDARNDSDD